MNPPARESLRHNVPLRRLAAALFFGLWTLGIFFAFPAPDKLVVEVDLASHTAGQLQLFVDAGRGFREELSTRSTVEDDGAVHRHRLMTAAPHQLNSLRLDPLDRPGELTLHRISVSFGGRQYEFAGETLTAWQPIYEVQSEPGENFLRLTSQGSDPQLHLTGPGNPFDSPWQRLAALPNGRRVALIFLVLPLLLLALGSDGRPWSPWGPVGETLLALAAPIGLLLANGLRALEDWWLLDDPCLLASTLRHGIGAHFFDPQVWRSLSGNVLMPWTTLSFGFDAHLFGAEPRAFYTHQLAAFALLIVLAFLVLRPVLSALGASLALSLFVTSAPAVAVVWRLMNRHYLEGTILTLLALALYRRAVERDRMALAVAGATLYLLATTAKEVFVPLVVLLPCVPIGSLRQRLRYGFPFAVTGALYALWRLYLLGPVNSFSGYAQSDGGSRFEHVLDAPRLLGITELWQLLGVAVLLAGSLVLVVRRSPSRLPFVLGTAVLLVLPLLPVADRLAPRHFFLPTFAFVCALGSAVRPWLAAHPLRWTAGALLLLLSGLQALEHAPVWKNREHEVRQYRGEGEFVLRAAPGEVLFTDLLNPSYLGCLGELRRLLDQGTGPGFCGDTCWCTSTLPEVDAARFEHGLIVPFEFTPDLTCASPRALTVEMHHDPDIGRLSWQLGPYTSGEYEVMLVHGGNPPAVSVPVPIGPQGSTPWALTQPLRWIIKFRSDEGWETFSPVLELDSNRPTQSWARPEPAPNKEP